MIKPTVGRVVLVTRPTPFSDETVPAFVCKVWGDRLINVGGFDENGDPFKASSVPLLRDADQIPDAGAYAHWMPYQQAVASGALAPTLHPGETALNSPVNDV